MASIGGGDNQTFLADLTVPPAVAAKNAYDFMLHFNLDGIDFDLENLGATNIKAAGQYIRQFSIELQKLTNN